MFGICIILHRFLPYKIHFLHNGEIVLAPHAYRVRGGKGVIGLFHEANTWWLRHTLFTDSLRLAAVKGLYPNDFSSITASYEMITMATPALSSRNGKWRKAVTDTESASKSEFIHLKHPESKGIKGY